MNVISSCTWRRFAQSVACAAALCVPVAASAQSAATIRDLICGRTVHYHTPGIGNQIEYTAPDGTAYLWYPDMPDAIIGTWQITPQGLDDAQTCFTYPLDEVDGAFGIYDGDPICFNSAALVRDVPERAIRDGDPYNLETGQVPFVLPSFPYLSIEELKRDFPAVELPDGCDALLS
jgi:hypothetical protein